GETVFSYEGASVAAQTETAPAEDKSTSTASAQPDKNVEGSDKSAVRQSEVEVPQSTFTSAGPVPAAPSTRRLARELGVDIRQVSGSGPAGRISQEDVKRHVKSAMQSGGAIATAGASAGAAIQATPLPDFSKWGDIERQELSGTRCATALQITC